MDSDDKMFLTLGLAFLITVCFGITGAVVHSALEPVEIKKENIRIQMENIKTKRVEEFMRKLQYMDAETIKAVLENLDKIDKAFDIDAEALKEATNAANEKPGTE